MAIKIMLDAGHYTNYNQSEVCKSYCEGNAMWTLQNYLKEELESYGFIVRTTRTNRDKDVAVVTRGQLAKGYDVFISLHSNACDNESVDRVIIFKGYNQGDKFSKDMAEAITKSIGAKQTYQVLTKKGSNGEYYGVLRGADSVGVKDRYLIEHGFHTNTKTAKHLASDSNLKALAIEEARVIASFYGYVKATPASTYYRVIAGSYTKKDNATKAVEKLKGHGISAFIEAVKK